MPLLLLLLLLLLLRRRRRVWVLLVWWIVVLRLLLVGPHASALGLLGWLQHRIAKAKLIRYELHRSAKRAHRRTAYSSPGSVSALGFLHCSRPYQHKPSRCIPVI